MNQNKNVLWIALIGVAVVLLVAFLLAKKPGDAGPPSAITPADAPAFPDGTPPLAPAVPVLPPETGTTQGDAVLPGASPAPAEIPAPPVPTPAQPEIPER